MSFLRFSTAIFREPLSFRQVLLARLVVGHGFATQKAKPTKVVVPKHPPNSFMMFASENRASVVEEYPEKTPREIMTILSVKWKAMSEDQKSPYKNAYAEKMKIYNAPLAKLPKKPPGVFGLFVKEKYPTVEARKPGAEAPEIMSELSSEWNSLTDVEKEQWMQKRESLLQQYKEQVMSFGKGMSAEERAFLEEKQGARMQQLEKEQRKLLGYPKRPPSSFILFMQKNADGLEDVPAIERTKMLGKKWREMSTEEKEEFFEENRKARERYKEDVAEWMEKNSQAL